MHSVEALPFRGRSRSILMSPAERAGGVRPMLRAGLLRRFDVGYPLLLRPMQRMGELHSPSHHQVEDESDQDGEAGPLHRIRNDDRESVRTVIDHFDGQGSGPIPVRMITVEDLDICGRIACRKGYEVTVIRLPLVLHDGRVLDRHT